MTGLAYFEWSADAKCSLDDRAEWRKANPALGVVRTNGSGLSEEYVAGVERDAMTDEEFAIERLGIFDDGEAAASVIPQHDWRACGYAGQDLDDWMADPVTLAVEVSRDRTWSSVGAAGACRDGGVAIETVQHRPGTDWVVGWVAERFDVWGVRAVVIDPRSAAGSMIRQLEELGVMVLQADTAAHVKACGELYDAIVAHEVHHLGQPELDAAAVGAITRPVGDAWMWDRRAGVVVTPLVAVGLARWGHLQPVEAEPTADFVML